MSNASVVNRIQALLSGFESGARTAFEIEAHFPAHISALEGLSSAHIDRSRNLVHALVLATIEEESSKKAIASALRELRAFVSELPT